MDNEMTHCPECGSRLVNRLGMLECCTCDYEFLAEAPENAKGTGAVKRSHARHSLRKGYAELFSNDSNLRESILNR